jgi:tetratricopeptide (TPR) repeat protein
MKQICCCVSIGVALIALGWMGGQQPLSSARAAELAYRAGDYHLALRLYQQELLPEDPARHAFNRGEVLYKLGILDQASNDFKSAVRSSNPERTARSCYDLGNCCLRLACRGKQKDRAARLKDAIECYDACISQAEAADPQLCDDARHNRMLAEQLLKQTNEAKGANQLVKQDEEECEH